MGKEKSTELLIVLVDTYNRELPLRAMIVPLKQSRAVAYRPGRADATKLGGFFIRTFIRWRSEKIFF